MAALASDWLRYFRLLLWNRWTEFNETLQGAISQRPLPSLCFSADRKHKIAAWPPIGWDIFDFFSETAESNSTKLDRKQDLNALYQVCVFRADLKIKMAALASDSPRRFQLLLWNRWTEFNETWQEARSQRPIQSLCLLGRSEKQNGRPGLWLAETFLTSPLKQLNGFQRNLTGSKLWMPSTTFVFFRPIRGKKGRPGLWLAETFSTSPLKPLKWIPWNLWHFLYSVGPHPVSSFYLYTFVVSRAFMAGAASQAGDADSSRAPGLTSGCRGPWMSTVVLYCWCHSDGASVILYFTLIGNTISMPSTKFVFFRWIGKTKWPPQPMICWDIFNFSPETAA